MGNFTFEFEAVGGHGCQREIKSGEVVKDCGNPSCPDCVLRRAVTAMKAQGNDIKRAILTHWPGETGEVRDNLLTGVRKGSF